MTGPRRELTAEYERNLRRLHYRLHPEGRYLSSGVACEVCMLLTKIDDLRSEIQLFESEEPR